MSDDLTAKLSADTTDWAAGMQSAAAEAQAVTRVIHEQETSWKTLANTAIPEIGRITSAVVGLAGTLATIHHQRQIIQSVTGPLSAVGAAAVRYIGPLARVVGVLVPQWKLVTTVIAGTALAINVANSDSVRGFVHQVTTSEKVSASYGRLKDAAGKLGDTIASSFNAPSSALGAFLDSINPIPAAIEWTGQKVTEFTDNTTKNVQELTSWWQKWIDILEATPVIWQEGADDERAQQIYDEAAALRERAKEQEAQLAHIQKVYSVYQAFGQVQQNAAAAAELNGQLQQVRDARTIEAINAQEKHWQKLIAAKIESGQLDAEQIGSLQEVFNLIASQKAGITSGAIKTKGEEGALEALRSLRDQNARLESGDKIAAWDRFSADGASPETLAALRKEYELNEALTAEKEHQKILAQEAEDAARRQQQIYESGQEKIRGLRDEIDLLTGATTKAEIATRKALEAGMSEAQAQAIGELTAERDRLEEAKREKEKKAASKKSSTQDPEGFRALVKGSADAYSAIFKAGRDSAQERAAKAAESTAKGVEKVASKIDELIDATESAGMAGMEIDS